MVGKKMQTGFKPSYTNLASNFGEDCTRKYHIKSFCAISAWINTWGDGYKNPVIKITEWCIQETFCSDKLAHTFPLQHIHRRHSATFASSQTRLCHNAWHAKSAGGQALKTNEETHSVNRQQKNSDIFDCGEARRQVIMNATHMWSVSVLLLE